MKRILLAILCISIMIFLPGCWDYVEYEDMAHVVGIGIDYDVETKETTVCIQYIPTGKSDKGSSSAGGKSSTAEQGVMHAATDKVFYNVVLKLQTLFSRKIFYGYMKTVVIGKAAAENIMLDLMELHDRIPAIRSTANIVITDGKAEDTLSTIDSSSNTSTSQEISNLLSTTKITGVAFPVSIEDFCEMLSIGGWEATAPRVITTAQGNKESEAKGGVKDGISNNEERDGNERIEGIAAFKGDKFAGWLNGREAVGFGLIRGEKMTTYKTSELPEDEDISNIIFYRINGVKSKVKVQIEKGKPAIYVEVKVTADLRKYYTAEETDMIGMDELKKLEEKLSESLRSDIDAALMKGQKELQTDIFGFGFAFFRKYPKLWQKEYEKKWSEIFPDIPVYVDVKSTIINTGTNLRKLIVK